MDGKKIVGWKNYRIGKILISHVKGLDFHLCVTKNI